MEVKHKKSSLKRRLFNELVCSSVPFKMVPDLNAIMMASCVTAMSPTGF